MTHQQQSTAVEEERGMTATPEPEEEEKAPAGETEVTKPEVDMEVWMQRIRNGWTLTTAAGITIGELYLIVSHI